MTPDADGSVLFTHNAGFSTMCGHGIIAATTVLLQTGLVMGRPNGATEDGARDGERRVGVDTPAGFVLAYAAMRGKRVAGVRFRNVPSFVLRLDGEVDVPGVGPVRYDVAYAAVQAADPPSHPEADDRVVKYVRSEYIHQENNRIPDDHVAAHRRAGRTAAAHPRRFRRPADARG